MNVICYRQPLIWVEHEGHTKIDVSFPSLTLSPTPTVNQSNTHSLLLSTLSRPHSLTPSLRSITHYIIPSLTCSLTPSLLHLLTHSLIPPTLLPTHASTHRLWPFLQSLTPLSTPSLPHSPLPLPSSGSLCEGASVQHLCHLS